MLLGMGPVNPSLHVGEGGRSAGGTSLGLLSRTASMLDLKRLSYDFDYAPTKTKKINCCGLIDFAARVVRVDIEN